MNTTNDHRIAVIRAKLEEALKPSLLTVVDESQSHIGHAGASGGGHFFVKIVAEVFMGKTLRECHQLVYAALGDLMRADIHALRISARPPEKGA